MKHSHLERARTVGVSTKRQTLLYKALMFYEGTDDDYYNRFFFPNIQNDT
jgi:hypothetical protein